MELIRENILLFILFIPFLGGIFLFAFPKSWAKWLALGFSIMDLAFALHLPTHFQILDSPNLQFSRTFSWIPTLGISFSLGIDGISMWLILLTVVLAPFVVLSDFCSEKIHEKAFYAFILFTQTGMLGSFMATDLFLFYIFWEGMLIPMYFLIGIWGGKRRLYATMKFFIYTMAGSLFMLLGIITLFLIHKNQMGYTSANIQDLYFLNLSSDTQIVVFATFAISFLIKVPLFPFHTWLPDAHVEAPTAGSVILAGVLLKLGGYGFLRLAMPIFPVGMKFFAPVILILAVIGIVYGALVAMIQKDLKKLIAYSSVSHMGYVMLGFFVGNIQGITGGFMQMLSHGLVTGGLFLIVGMIYERSHTREISDYGGLAKSMPLLSFCFMVLTLASIGLPGSSGFIGEFLVLLGTFRVNKVYALVGGLGVILGAIYMLWMFQRVVFGSTTKKTRILSDLGWRESLMLIPLVLLIIVMGVYPKPILRTITPSIEQVIKGPAKHVAQN